MIVIVKVFKTFFYYVILTIYHFNPVLKGTKSLATFNWTHWSPIGKQVSLYPLNKWLRGFVDVNDPNSGDSSLCKQIDTRPFKQTY